jgi:hypothetical protein
LVLVDHGVLPLFYYAIMHCIFWISSVYLLTTGIQAHPSREHVPREEQAIAIASITELGDVHSSTTYVKRDLGFQGQLGQYILLSYGDTLFTDKNYSSTFRGIVSNSVAFATHDPTTVVDPALDENGYPPQFVPLVPAWNENQSTHAVGITSVIETTPNQGRPCPPTPCSTSLTSPQA